MQTWTWKKCVASQGVEPKSSRIAATPSLVCATREPTAIAPQHKKQPVLLRGSVACRLNVAKPKQSKTKKNISDSCERRQCHGRIVWVCSGGGSIQPLMQCDVAHPLDARLQGSDPASRNNDSIQTWPIESRLKATGKRYVCHQFSCPSAVGWRLQSLCHTDTDTDTSA